MQFYMYMYFTLKFAYMIFFFIPLQLKSWFM